MTPILRHLGAFALWALLVALSLMGKRRYFYDQRVYLLVTAQRQPVEFFLMPGAHSDIKALQQYAFELPENATITGDKAYNDYRYEALLHEAGLHLTPLRKKNSKRPLSPAVAY